MDVRRAHAGSSPLVLLCFLLSINLYFLLLHFGGGGLHFFKYTSSGNIMLSSSMI